jgi:hypothetical protein
MRWRGIVYALPGLMTNFPSTDVFSHYDSIRIYSSEVESISTKVLFIGGGDVGLQMANSLLAQARIDCLVIADWNARAVGPRAAMLGNCHGVKVEFEQIDGRDKSALEAMIRRAKPDLIVQSASLISPWSIIGRAHPVAQALSNAGIALQIPAQLPILMNVMQIVRELGVTVPVANITMPDILHPLLARLDLAPTIGLGNVSIHHLRVRHRLLERDDFNGDEEVRVLGHHCQVYDVMKAALPANEDDRVKVFIGASGQRHDTLAYEGAPFASGPIYNEITAASAIPVLMALLPGTSRLQFSAPAPMGLPGGYPVVMDNGEIALDLPSDLSRDEAIALNRRQGERDGVARIDTDGTLYFTDKAMAAVAELDSGLSEPIEPGNLADRTEKFMRVIAEIK